MGVALVAIPGIRATAKSSENVGSAVGGSDDLPPLKA